MFTLMMVALVAFLSATLLPLGSEALVLSYSCQPPSLSAHAMANLWMLGLAATLGNTLGACVNWWLGRYLLVYQHKAWFPVKEAALHKAQDHFQRYGYWSLLFTWLPLIGDPITFIAGLMRVPFLLFTLLTALGKGARYAILMYAASQLC